MTDYIDQVFGADGIFAREFQGYEMRPGQVEISRAGDRAFAEHRACLAEGPTGTGKSVGYLVPAIFHAHASARRTLVVTANIALQEQLVKKDLPMLQRVLPWKFDFAIMKGRSNYLCQDRHENTKRHLPLMRSDDFRRTLEWADETTTGDSSELDFSPDFQTWEQFSVSSEDCKGAECPERDRCSYKLAKQRAAGANIVVTNYAMLFLHIAIGQVTGGQGGVLPPFDQVVLDEAHQAAEIARDHFGFQVSEFGLRRIAAKARSFAPEWAADLDAEARTFFQAAFDFSRSKRYRIRLSGTQRFADPEPIANVLRELAREALSEAQRSEPGIGKVRAQQVHEQCQVAEARLREVVEQSDEGKVYFFEDSQNKDRVKVRALVIDVAPILREALFGVWPTVMTSATLADGEGRDAFAYARRECGVPDEPAPIEAVAQSPFDYARQAVLCVPRGVPEPKERDFAPAAARALQATMDAAGGRTLGLFTSWRSLREVGALVNGHPIMRQGEAPRTVLVERFRAERASSLFGVASFWEGLDVPGDACVAVVIDKLPFPHPEDPIIDALSERAGSRAFSEVSLPRTIIALRQGVGRLVRTRSDRGVVVILDRRLSEKGYGRRILRSLPAMRVTRDLGDALAFVREIGIDPDV